MIMYVCVHACMYVCVSECMFIKLHITAQSGPVIRVIICHSHVLVYVCMYVCVSVCIRGASLLVAPKIVMCLQIYFITYL